MKPINDFAHQIGAEIALKKNLVMKQNDHYFLISNNLKIALRPDFFYAGIYLGKAKGRRFFPSFNLLEILSRSKSNKVVIDKKTSWLFICGRDIFRKGILSFEGSTQRDSHTLIMNEYNECLGFGRIIRSLNKEGDGVFIKNISDVGDFLRREM